nr:hypothetical protein [Tanacetum cinerariifolium]
METLADLSCTTNEGRSSNVSEYSSLSSTSDHDEFTHSNSGRGRSQNWKKLMKNDWLTPLLLIMLGTLKCLRMVYGSFAIIRLFFESGIRMLIFLKRMLGMCRFRLSYARVMIELQANVELKDNIVIFGHTQEECPKNIRLGVANLKKPSQTSRGVLVGPKVGFKPHKEYRPVPKKPTASPRDNKKKGVAHTNEVNNSNLFDVLNSADNDVEFGTNGGNINLVNNGANSSGSYFSNVVNCSTSNTPIIGKIKKFEDLLIDGEAILVDEADNPFKKVECPGDYDREDEVASFDNDIARSLASEMVGFNSQSLLEQ